MTTEDAFAFIDEELDELRRRQLWREWRVSDSAPANELLVEGRAYLNFCSNNYLGLAQDPEVIEAARTATAQYGAGSGAARLICGTQRPTVELEESLARFKGAEAALVFSSGYLANLGAVASLVGPQDAVIVDRLAHASLLDAARLSRAKLFVFKHNDLDSLEEQLQKAGKRRRRLIVIDGVYSMDGDIAPLKGIGQLTEKHDAMLLVDDAHGLGAVGDGGRGTVRLHGVDPARVVQMGTLSKALGSLGGFIAGPRRLIELLTNRARPFIFDTALPAAAVAAASKGLELIEREPQRVTRLQENAARLRRGIAALGLDAGGSETQIIPVIIGDSAKTLHAAEQLRQRGFFVVGVRPPAVKKGAARLRLTTMATHTPQMLDKLLAALAQLRDEL